ncbi:MAG: hypothetical protein UT49_C0003G0039 [Parcubacteria group bacterium GW2011_GWF1_39_37]|nr:MAG: hypothetical protein UT49_C0003G0039 [Parcubacteria group bacterium GW2011_GWF1_39_37]KKR51882.1 MAG: hypothetical protein UT89_C0005G0039 [Parcubacteria group bacterium GW2011_GWE1_40_20]KKS35770.1 MAG: hypothetical protein UU99_C0004G0039 [Parcubacteria group bacterium GW2011_GWE2_42_14]
MLKSTTGRRAVGVHLARGQPFRKQHQIPTPLSRPALIHLTMRELSPRNVSTSVRRSASSRTASATLCHKASSAEPGFALWPSVTTIASISSMGIRSTLPPVFDMSTALPIPKIPPNHLYINPPSPPH